MLGGGGGGEGGFPGGFQGFRVSWVVGWMVGVGVFWVFVMVVEGGFVRGRGRYGFM